ncbi:MAG: sugar ABC transporter substrate-binding protein [Pirellula sp.]|nr:sugar ABC transporter substrate-binding protein [Pirellula sp.]
MTKFFAAIATVSCFVVWIGCNAPKVDTAPAKTIESGASEQPLVKPKVALIMKSLANEFFSTMAQGAKTHNEANSDYELIVNGIKDERDLARQSELVDEMVAAGCQAIVIAPADSKALIPSLRKAIKSGVIVVNIDNKLDASILESEGIAIPFVGPDNRQGAKMVAEQVVSKLKAGDEVAILEGITTSFNAQQRKAGFEDALRAGQLKIVSSQSAQWEMNLANTIAASMLSEYPNLKAILASNDSMALGAVAAIKSAGRSEQVLVVGFDNIEATREAIRAGKMLATADQHGDQLAVYGIEFALAQVKNPDRRLEDKQTAVDLVTKESLGQP